MKSQTSIQRPTKKRSNGAGSLYARRDRHGHVVSYRAVLTLGWQADKQVRQSLTAASREEAGALLDHAVMERQGTTLPSGSPLTVSRYLDQWMQHKAGEVRQSTLRSYRGIVENHLKPILGRERLDGLRPRHIDHLHQQIQSKKLSHRTLEHAHMLLHGALGHAVRLELLPRNVAQAVNLPRRTIPRAEMKVWTTEQVGLFLHQASTHRLYALFYLALATGMRRGELMALTWENTDLERDILHVRSSLVELKGGIQITEPKTRASRRPISLASDTVDVLRQHQLTQRQHRARMGVKWREHSLVFPTQIGTYLDSANLTRDFRRLIETAGVPVIRLHDLRHTHASLLALRGVTPKVIADRLGHINVSFTMQVYTHLYDEQRREAAPNLAELLQGKG